MYDDLTKLYLASYCSWLLITVSACTGSTGYCRALYNTELDYNRSIFLDDKENFHIKVDGLGQIVQSPRIPRSTLKKQSF